MLSINSINVVLSGVADDCNIVWMTPVVIYLLKLVHILPSSSFSTEFRQHLKNGKQKMFTSK